MQHDDQNGGERPDANPWGIWKKPGQANTTARHGASPQIGRHIQTAEATSDRPGRPRPPNAVHRFRFEDADIRIILIDSEPWFVAADVCRALQLASHKGSYGAHLDKLDPDEKQQIDRQIAVTITPGGTGGSAESKWAWVS